MKCDEKTKCGYAEEEGNRGKKRGKEDDVKR
jgi:hypothetical protein